MFFRLLIFKHDDLSNWDVIFYEKNFLYKKLINSICKTLRYTLFLPITLVTKKIKNKKRLRNINEFILKNVGDIRKTVIIFQSLFFDTNGKHFYAGGAERYCLDLADIIIKLGFEPLLIQQSSCGFWTNTKNNLKVLGIPYFNLFCSNKLFAEIENAHVLFLQYFQAWIFYHKKCSITPLFYHMA